MDIKVNALMLRAVDYNENDKILTLLTAEKGKISAGIKGVKKAAAKLKFAAQPFCFAEYVLSSRGDKHTVINATECEKLLRFAHGHKQILRRVCGVGGGERAHVRGKRVPRNFLQPC